MIETLKPLIKDEKVINHSRVHWILFAPPAVYLFIALLVSIFFHPFVGAAIVLMSVYPSYNAYIGYEMTHLVLTDHKVIAQTGWLSRDITQMKLERIENAYLEQPIIGRYLGYSTVVVSGVGQGHISIPAVVNGDKFIEDLEVELEKVEE